MGAFGWHNPWPFEWGGDPTEVESIYNALRSAVGSLAAEDDSGIDGLWRACKAQMIPAATSCTERAVMQAFPQAATDHLPLWEAYLAIVPPVDATDVSRRAAIIEIYTRNVLADGPDLRLSLKTIDPRFEVLTVSRDLSTITVLGYPYASHSPAYSSDYVIPIQFVTVALDSDRRILARARAMLNDTLPAWVDYSIVAGSGFVLDQSNLDVTAMT
jgi:hypothetical protein